jgi:glutaredoxin
MKMVKRTILALAILLFTAIPFYLAAKSVNKTHPQILQLYYFPECPYCQKVLKFIERAKISVQLKNIQENVQDLEILIKIGGKKQVPCLFIDGKPLYESDDIINWLKREGLGKPNP